MGKQSLKYQTQWVAQFYAAAELTRRGYLVSLTFGNAPVADLLVTSPCGRHFMVDIKGQSTPNFWLIQPREQDNNLFYIFVFLPKPIIDPPAYFIMSCAEMLMERNAYRDHIMSNSGPYRDELGGFNFSAVEKYQNHWDTLPI